MAFVGGDNPVNPAVRCVTSSKLPVCDDAKLPICEVYGLADNVGILSRTILQNTFLRSAFTNVVAQTVDNLQWDAAANEFVVVKAGNYKLSYDLTVAGASVSDSANAFIAVNGAAAGASGSAPVRYAGSSIKAPVSAVRADISGSTVIPLVVGDRVGVYVSADSAGGGLVELTAVGRLSVHSLIGNFS